MHVLSPKIYCFSLDAHCLLCSFKIAIFTAVTATILGAMPIVSTYWATLPGVIELLFVRGSYWLALFLFGLHLLPHFFLDTALYSEIKGAGHPYLTGLSIAGGLYYFGAEGAFIGPILLCFLLVGVNLYRCFLTSEATNLQSISPPTTIFMSHSKPTVLSPLRFSNFVTARRTRRPKVIPRSVSEELFPEASHY
uniref:Transmembrane protein 245 n=1 Tax=Schistocephalus solidus TaxID=70667 RepID=A0A0X3NLM6_SCHSO